MDTAKQNKPLNTLESQTTITAVLIPIENLIIDISVVEAVRAYDKIRAREVEYDWEICDDHLLPLRRMAEMLSERSESRPPVTLERRGRYFKIIDGRHRLTRALLNRELEIKAIILNDSRDFPPQ